MNDSASVPALHFRDGTLVLEPGHAAASKAAPPGAPWRWDARVGAWRCDAIEYPAAAEALRARVGDQVPRWRPVHWPAVDLPRLRPEQDAAVRAWMAARRGVVVMPTGTGKTEVALSILKETAVSTLVVAPVRDLMYQWHRRIQRGLGVDAGIVGDNRFNVRPVSVTTYDSAAIHMDRLGADFQLVVFDECHHLPGRFWRDAALMSAAPMRLGLSATPERSDGAHADLDRFIGPVVYRLPLSAVRGKSLADYDVVRVPVRLGFEEQTRYDEYARRVRRYMTDRRKTDPGFSWRDLCADVASEPAAREARLAFLAKQAIEDRAAEKLRILEDLFRLHAGAPVLVFAGSNAMARDVSLRFLIPCLLSHCRKRERREILEGLADGTYPAVVANRVLDEGVDLPEVKVAVVLGGLASTRQATQRLGRVLRKRGGARAVLYEVVCRTAREELRSRKRRRSDAYEGTIRRAL